MAIIINDNNGHYLKNWCSCVSLTALLCTHESCLQQTGLTQGEGGIGRELLNLPAGKFLVRKRDHGHQRREAPRLWAPAWSGLELLKILEMLLLESTGSNWAMQMNHSLFKWEQPELEALDALAARALYASSHLLSGAGVGQFVLSTPLVCMGDVSLWFWGE